MRSGSPARVNAMSAARQGVRVQVPGPSRRGFLEPPRKAYLDIVKDVIRTFRRLAERVPVLALAHEPARFAVLAPKQRPKMRRTPESGYLLIITPSNSRGKLVTCGSI